MRQRVECFKRLVATHWSKPFAACLKVGGSCRLVVVCFVSVDQHLSCTTCTLCSINQLVLLSLANSNNWLFRSCFELGELGLTS
jgi:hypothetical protein